MAKGIKIEDGQGHQWEEKGQGQKKDLERKDILVTNIDEWISFCKHQVQFQKNTVVGMQKVTMWNENECCWRKKVIKMFNKLYSEKKKHCLRHLLVCIKTDL